MTQAHANITKQTSVCPFCEANCGVILEIDRENQKVVSAKGDKDDPFSVASWASPATTSPGVVISKCRVEANWMGWQLEMSGQQLPLHAEDRFAINRQELVIDFKGSCCAGPSGDIADKGAASNLHADNRKPGSVGVFGGLQDDGKNLFGVLPPDHQLNGVAGEEIHVAPDGANQCLAGKAVGKLDPTRGRSDDLGSGDKGCVGLD